MTGLAAAWQRTKEEWAKAERAARAKARKAKTSEVREARAAMIEIAQTADLLVTTFADAWQRLCTEASNHERALMHLVTTDHEKNMALSITSTFERQAATRISSLLAKSGLWLRDGKEVFHSSERLDERGAMPIFGQLISFEELVHHRTGAVQRQVRAREPDARTVCDPVSATVAAAAAVEATGAIVSGRNQTAEQLYAAKIADMNARMETRPGRTRRPRCNPTPCGSTAASGRSRASSVPPWPRTVLI